MKILMVFILIIFVKLALNLVRLLETKHLYRIFQKHPDNIYEYAPFVTSVFNSAGTNTVILSTTKTNGLNQATYDYLSNSIGKSNSYTAIDVAFQKTIGEYKFRLIQAINPFYWLFLPKYIFQRMNKPLKTSFEILLNLLYWLTSVIAAYLVEHFLDLHLADWTSLICDVLPK